MSDIPLQSIPLQTWFDLLKIEIGRLTVALEDARDFAREYVTDRGHDSDAHKNGTWCAKCAAELVLEDAENLVIDRSVEDIMATGKINLYRVQDEYVTYVVAAENAFVARELAVEVVKTADITLLGAAADGIQEGLIALDHRDDTD